MKNIGLLGGSFDPPHKGHLYISLEAKKILKLDEIWWLVTPQNPLKINQPASYSERVKNCKILTKNKPCLLYTSPSPRDAHESRMPSSA